MDGPVRVLHVDDDPDFGELTATMLARDDDRVTVETVTRATEGLELLESVARSQDRMETLIEELLALARAGETVGSLRLTIRVPAGAT
ncbi:MAG: hypothetical protein BRD21_07680 [Halobacteriales archaeon SW_8_66_22]|nr:MAG: hypothetical protein BRD21_07680 [Halobacteriales archaeon SW_8_66_22]